MVVCKAVFLEDVLNEITIFAPGRDPQKAPKSIPNRSKPRSRECSKMEPKINTKKMTSEALLNRSAILPCPLKSPNPTYRDLT